MNTVAYNEKSNFKNEINIIYKTESKGEQQIFGYNFVKNNKNNIDLIINYNKSELIDNYCLKEGINNIKLIIKNNITNLEYMFYDCKALYSIDELRYLNTSCCTNFSKMFYYTEISDLKPLENWDVSNGTNFIGMFMSCSNISDITPLQKWDVSKGIDFSDMFFSFCSKISDIKPLEKWNVSNGINFERMFDGLNISTIKPLENWNVSNGTNFKFMFSNCSRLTDIKALKNWNVSNGTNFKGIFCFTRN